MEVTIFDAQGNVRTTGTNIEYSGEYMGDVFVTIDFSSGVPVNFEIGDYVEYRGDVFTLNVVPTCKKQAKKKEKGDAFVYEKVKFNSFADELTRCTFKDVVPADNEIHWTGLAQFSFYCESVRDLAERIQANLDFVYGTGTWSVIVDDNFTETKDISLSASDNTVWEALKMVYDNFNANFIIRGRKITIGTSGTALGTVFRYGIGNGLKSLGRAADESQLVVTRLRAYGNTANLPTNYYKYICMYTNPIQKGSIKTGVDFKGDDNLPGIVIGFSMDALQDKLSYEQLFKDDLVDSSYDPSSGYGIRYWYNWIQAMKTEASCQLGVRYKVTSSDEEKTVYGIPFYSERENVDVYGEHTFYIWLYVSSNDFRNDFVKFGTESCISLFGTGFDMSYLLKKYTDFVNTEMYPNNMAVTHLMLPGFPTEKGERDLGDGYKLVYSNSDVYIDSPNASKYGVREGSVYIDGTDNEVTDADVYPSVIDMTADELRAAGFDLDLPDNDNGHLDELADAQTISDNGDRETSRLSTNVVKVWLKDIGFNPKTYALSGETMTIHMKSGMCAGREFEITNVYEDTTSGNLRYRLTLERAKDELGYYYPNTPFNIKAGDEFVLLGIRMPDAYIKAASERLLNYALLYLKYNDFTRFSYTPEMDNIFVAREYDKLKDTEPEKSIYWSIHEGDLFMFDDSEDLGIKGSLFISSLTIRESDSAEIPEIEVTLEDRKSAGTLSRVQSAISEVLSGGSGGGGLNISEAQAIVKDSGGKLFLSKVTDDEASGLIGFNYGIVTNDGAAETSSVDYGVTAADGVVEWLYN